MKRQLLASVIAVLCAGVALNAAAAPKKKEKTVGDLASRPVVIQPDQKVEASAERAMDNYRRFLELQKTDPQLRAEALREAQNRWVRVQKARGAMPNNTGQFAERVAALRARLDASQQRLAGVAKQQNALLESLARVELEEQKERIGTYQIQARFALASIYDRAALGGGAVSAPAGQQPSESQGELEVVPAEPATPEGTPPGDQTTAPQDAPAPAPDSPEPGVNTSPPPEGTP